MYYIFHQSSQAASHVHEPAQNAATSDTKSQENDSDREMDNAIDIASPVSKDSQMNVNVTVGISDDEGPDTSTSPVTAVP